MKEQEKVKLYRTSDGARKEFRKDRFSEYMKEAHFRKGFKLVEEYPEAKVKKGVVAKEKPAPNFEPVAEASEPVAEKAVDLNSMTVKELRKIAQEQDVADYSSMKKADLIDALTK